MSYGSDHPDRCSVEGCTNSVPQGHWAKGRENWFFQRNGDNFCPEHIPAWVEGWRKKKGFKNAK